jgi:predicted small metal-binding protein
MKSLTCKDVGFDCDAVIKGDTEDEIMQKAGEHASREHDIKPEDMTSEMQQKIKGLIRTS